MEDTYHIAIKEAKKCIETSISFLEEIKEGINSEDFGVQPRSMAVSLLIARYIGETLSADLESLVKEYNAYKANQGH